MAQGDALEKILVAIETCLFLIFTVLLACMNAIAPDFIWRQLQENLQYIKTENEATRSVELERSGLWKGRFIDEDWVVSEENDYEEVITFDNLDVQKPEEDELQRIERKLTEAESLVTETLQIFRQSNTVVTRRTERDPNIQQREYEGDSTTPLLAEPLELYESLREMMSVVSSPQKDEDKPESTPDKNSCLQEPDGEVTETESIERTSFSFFSLEDDEDDVIAMFRDSIRDLEEELTGQISCERKLLRSLDTHLQKTSGCQVLQRRVHSFLLADSYNPAVCF